MVKLVKDRSIVGNEMKKVVVNTLDKLMNENDKIYALEADLGSASGFIGFEKTHPDRFIQCGIAEANMVGVAAGMSVMGNIPFIHSFAPFVSRRIFDQLFLSGAYAKTNINVMATDPGFTTAANGGTHTTFEDIAMMRTIPNAVICDPCDEVEIAAMVELFAKSYGIHYLRYTRKPIRKVYDESETFEFGKGKLLCKGNDVLLIACGQFVSDCLDVAERLSAEGISCSVIDPVTIKPLDIELIKNEAEGKKFVMSVENHSINGGLGSAISEVLAENNVNTKFKRHGINEEFGQVGTIDYLQKAFKLTADDIYKIVKENL